MHLVNNIDIQNGLLGGVILGVSASAFMFLTGKVAGLSGIAEGVVSVKGENWNYSYVAGLGTAGALLSIYRPNSFGDASNLSSGAILAAGLITGFGTRLAGGCTSGHGLCGMARRSPRSLTAVLTFMTTGALTAYFTRLPENAAMLVTPTDETMFPLVPVVTAAVGGLYVAFNFSAIARKVSGLFASAPKSVEVVKNTAGRVIHDTNMHIAAFSTSLLFGLGLGISGMCNPSRVLRFLDFSGPEGWDPTLASVLGGGVLVTFASFHFFKSANAPIALCSNQTPVGASLHMGTVPANMLIDWKLLLGSALFGVGWGLAGMCPGPAMVVAAGGGAAALKFVPSMIAGMIAKEILLG